jgi:hypothetical protein
VFVAFARSLMAFAPAVACGAGAPRSAAACVVSGCAVGAAAGGAAFGALAATECLLMSAFGCWRAYVASASFDENVVPPLRLPRPLVG